MMLGRFLTTAALAIREDGTYTPFSADAWGYAGQMTLLGMLMVFSVLGILWGVLAIFKVVFAEKKPKANKSAADKSAPAQNTQEQSAPVVAQNNDAELIAVLTAAVAAYMADEGAHAQDGSFRVVSFTRVRSGRAWNTK